MGHRDSQGTNQLAWVSLEVKLQEEGPGCAGMKSPSCAGAGAAGAAGDRDAAFPT